MRRLSAIMVFWAVAFMSSAPAWALVAADHSCCSAAGVTAKLNEKVAGKHAHCAAMARKITAATPTSDRMSAVHTCHLCNISALTRPQSTTGINGQTKIAHISEMVERPAAAFTVALGERAIHAQRGPPSFPV